MSYRCEVTSVAGFVQQIACCYLRHGYWWYVTGVIPDHKDPKSVDRKLIDRYDIDITEWRRARNKQLGRANIQYLRHGHFFALLATKGEHHFYQEEATQIRDIRRRPLRYAGYSISYRRGGRTRKGEPDPNWHAHVEIDRERYKELKAWLVDISTKRSTEFLTEVLGNLPYEPYAPIRRQKLNLLRTMNRQREHTGFERIAAEALRLRRRTIRPFESAEPTV